MLLGGCSVLDQICTAPAIVCNEMTYALFAVLICFLPVCTDQKAQPAVLKDYSEGLHCSGLVELVSYVLEGLQPNSTGCTAAS